jgi:hypothetical protein
MTVVMLKRTGIRIGNQHWSIANMVLLPGVGRGGAVKGVPSIIGVFEKDPTTSGLDCPNFSSACPAHVYHQTWSTYHPHSPTPTQRVSIDRFS